MSSDTARLTIPIKCFIAGIIPYILFFILGFFEMLNLYGGPGTVFIVLLVVIIPPICFIGRLIEALKSRDKHRRMGLTLNGLSLAILPIWLFYGWLAN